MPIYAIHVGFPDEGTHVYLEIPFGTSREAVEDLVSALRAEAREAGERLTARIVEVRDPFGEEVK